MAETAAGLASGEQVAILFGPERAGLENDDIARADAIISVPVDPEYASLNLAQCALLTAYEWRRQSTDAVPRRNAAAQTPTASALEIERLGEHYESRLTEAGFFFPEDKAPGMKQTLRNMWSRLALTRGDVQVLHGILRQMVRWKDHG
jgi:tRNA/rRNA methyltransferase